VRGEHDDGTLRHLGVLLDEHRALRLERAHHVGVVHDLLAHEHRRSEALERQLHRLHRAVHTRAVAAGLGQQDTLRAPGHAVMVRAVPSLPR
jgi:hypothetical protein